MKTKDRLQALIQQRGQFTAASARAELNLSEAQALHNLMKLRNEGQVCLAGRGLNAVWCLPELADQVAAEIAARKLELRQAANRRNKLAQREKYRRGFLSWAEGKPVQRIVPAAATKPPRIGVRSVWELAA